MKKKEETVILCLTPKQRRISLSIKLLLGPIPGLRKKPGSGNIMPCPFLFYWYARQDSNLRPTDSKSRNLRIQKMLIQHLDLWEVRPKLPPCANGPPTEAFIIYDEASSPSADDYIIDTNYPMDLSRRSS